MMYMKRIVMFFFNIIFLTACVPGTQYTSPSGLTFVAVTDNPEQVATLISNMLTQTVIPATSTPVPGVATLPVVNEASPASIRPLSSGGLKPPDSDTPVSGICTESQGEIVEFTLTSAGPAMPRCAKVAGPQRIRLINGTGVVVQVSLAHFNMSIPVGGSVLLDQRVDEYLAPGVHSVNGAEVWVIANSPPPVVTVPPPIVQYVNSVVGYSLGLPGDWQVDENGMTSSSNKEVIFSPPNAEPFKTYLSVSLDFRTLEQIINYYAQNVPNAIREDTIFNGHTAIKYKYTSGRNEYFISYGNQIFLALWDLPWSPPDMGAGLRKTAKFTPTYGSHHGDSQRTKKDEWHEAGTNTSLKSAIADSKIVFFGEIKMSNLFYLIEAERAFSVLSNTEGLRKGFLTYLSDDGLIYRPNPVSGKGWYQNQPSLTGYLAWEPVFAEISASSELGYTLGPWMYKTGLNDEVIATGYYVSVWKMQPDSSWKVVADSGVQCETQSLLRKWPPLQDLINKPSSLFAFSNLDKKGDFNMENIFTEDAMRDGLPLAYLSYADIDLQIFRANNNPCKGKKAIRTAASYSDEVDSNRIVAKGVSLANDLGYSCGSMKLKGKDGKELHYLRIWKKKSESDWKLVLDITLC